MGFKQWLAKKTSNPAAYGRTIAPATVQLAEHLASGITNFAGVRPGGGKSPPAFFETSFQLEQAGFEPVGGLLPTSFEEMIASDPTLAAQAFRVGTAFVCLYATNSAHKYMKKENAEHFGAGFLQAVVHSLSGRPGFTADPGRDLRTLFPVLRCNRLLNIKSPGQDDGLGVLLLQIALSESERQYAFVVGSEKQKFGCLSNLIEVALAVDDSVKRVAHDLQW